MKITHKLTLALMAGILLVHGASATIWILRETEQIHEDMARDELVIGSAVGHTFARIWRVDGREEALAYLHRASERREHVALRWIWLDAERGDPHAAVASRDQLAPLSDGKTVVARLGDEDAAIYAYVPVEVQSERRGAIEIADSLADEDRYLRESVVAAVATAATLVGLCTLLAWGLGMMLVSRPVASLLEHARAVGAGDLSRRLAARSKDEIGELAATLNEMSERLTQARDRAETETQAKIAALEQLRHADRLATVGTLASGVAHELGTPINVVDGHATLICEDPGANDSCKESAGVIRRQCQNMTRTIGDLLRFARRGENRDACSDVEDVVRETLRMLEPLAHKRGIRATLEVDEALVARMAFDPLQQVLANVIVNGIQAMPAGGALKVRMSKERAAPARNAALVTEYVCLRVEDCGIGIDEQTRRRIFEPFFTTKDVGEGTGLGLSVAFGIVEDHSGWIDVSSQPGRGSTFSIYIPVGEAA